jgi:hypothetical protein
MNELVQGRVKVSIPEVDSKGRPWWKEMGFKERRRVIPASETKDERLK